MNTDSNRASRIEILMNQIKALTESFTTEEMDQVINELASSKKTKIKDVLIKLDPSDIEPFRNIIKELYKEEMVQTQINLQLETSIYVDCDQVLINSHTESGRDYIEFDSITLEEFNNPKLTQLVKHKNKLLTEYNNLINSTIQKYKITKQQIQKLLNEIRYEDEEDEEYDDEEE